MYSGSGSNVLKELATSFFRVDETGYFTRGFQTEIIYSLLVSLILVVHPILASKKYQLKTIESSRYISHMISDLKCKFPGPFLPLSSRKYVVI
jgi:hypothetical protein